MRWPPVQAANGTQSWYRVSAPPSHAHIALLGSARADICVVGGGFTGLSAALHLAEKGAKVALIEVGTVGSGASGRNGGQIHTGLRQRQKALERWLGKEHARALWDLAQESKALVRDLAARHGIDCALKDGLVIAAHHRRALRPLAEDTEHLRRHYNYGQAEMIDAAGTARCLGTSVYPGGRLDKGGGHLHPLAFARGLARAGEAAGVRFHEHTRAVRIEQNERCVRVQCESGAIDAGQVILACDALSGDVAPQLAPFIAHVESFIVATEPLASPLYDTILPLDAAVADTRHVLDYYRKSEDRRLLFGGRESYWTPPADIAAMVRPRMESVYPFLKGARIEFAWSGTVGITATRMPHFGRIGSRVLFAHGYSGQGVALANLGGKLLAEAALGAPERFDVFARVPAKVFPGNAWLRKPLVTAGLAWFKLLDYF
ncbi:MAG: FAD-binding oxidoreductase [Alphaproteobacteria bacterium]|nr:FAD-binding oxidoreductase [Alphaproteobacteria bacterium]